MNILIVDDHQLVRDGVKSLIEQEFGWYVPTAVASINDIADLTQLENIDVAIIDITLRDMSGFDVLSRIKSDFAHIKCLMLSMHDGLNYICKALDMGAEGYVTKSAATSEIISALESLERGSHYFSTDIANTLVNHNGNAISKLTEREKEVFVYLAKGYKPKKISAIINAMPKTVMVHRTNIYQKLGVKSQFDLLRIALQDGIMSVDEFLDTENT